MFDEEEEQVFSMYFKGDNSWTAFAGHGVTKKLPAGMYSVTTNFNDEPSFKPISNETDELLDIQDQSVNKLHAELKRFWSKEVKQKCKDFGYLYKYGVLLYGKPGTGKTSLIMRVAQYIYSMNGIVIYNSKPNDVNIGIKAIKCIEADRPIVVVYEDIDSWLDVYEEDILALTDGELQSDNIVYIATTNSIKNLPDRIKNRPSRFASVIETKYPTTDMRTAYISKKLPNINTTELSHLVNITNGMSLDHIKSLILSVFCLQCDMDETLEKLKTMN